MVKATEQTDYTDDTNEDVLGALFRLMHQVKQAPSDDDPVERPAIIVLARLKEHGAMRLSDLAGDLCLDVSTVSRHVRTLEDRGFVERAGDPDDRRAVQLTITDEGRAVLAEAWAHRQAWIDRSVADWSVADLRELGAVLGRLADALAADSAARAVRPARTTRTETSA
jgi:DNA-binding MarR family transcriptional regulator